MQTTKVSSGSSSPLIVEERTLREKVIREEETGRVVSKVTIQIGPTLGRYVVEDETTVPVVDRHHQETAEVGYWKRLVRAVKTWGLG